MLPFWWHFCHVVCRAGSSGKVMDASPFINLHRGGRAPKPRPPSTATTKTLRKQQQLCKEDSAAKKCCTNNNTVKAARVALIQLKIPKKRAVHGNSAETAMPRPKLEQCCSSNCNSAAECKRKLQNQRRAWRRHPSSRPFTPALGRQK